MVNHYCRPWTPVVLETQGLWLFLMLPSEQKEVLFTVSQKIDIYVWYYSLR